jgi:hypothetical protein
MGITTRSIHGFENPGKRGIGGVKLEALDWGAEVFSRRRRLCDPLYPARGFLWFSSAGTHPVCEQQLVGPSFCPPFQCG